MKHVYALPAAFLLIILAAFSCARLDKREPRYNAKECPFCVPRPGVCHYCNGAGKCTFCNGTGTRTTVSPAFPEKNLGKTTYTEKCPYCKGSGKCRYCDGVGKCRACKGTGHIESWDFYGEYMKEKPAMTSAAAPVDTSAKAQPAVPAPPAAAK